MADAADLKSAEGFLLYGFESRLRHHLQFPANMQLCNGKEVV